VLLPCDKEFKKEFDVESTLLISDPKCGHKETELILRRQTCESDRVWMVAMRGESPIAIKVPPQPEDQAAEIREVRDLSRRTVWLAALTREYGAWEAFWLEEGCSYAVWSTASRFWNETKFLAFLDSLEFH
jgi:hypothetical protein